MTGLPLTLLLSANTAFAGWGDFEALFQAFPCPDGWMACLVAESPLTPEPITDGAGIPGPSSMRVGWFDLAPTRAFSPFAALSPYAAIAQVAVAEVEVGGLELAAQQAADEAERQRVAAEQAESIAREQAAAAAKERAAAQKRAQEEAEAARKAAENSAVASAEEKARLVAEADAARKRAEVAEKQRIKAEAEERARQEIARLEAEKAAKAVELARANQVAAQASAEEARRKKEAEVAAQAAAEAARVAKAAAAGTPLVADVSVTRPPPVVTDDSCAELPKLEPQAILGQLTPGQIGCLEKRVGDAAEKQTDRNRVSRLLMGNSFAKGDKNEWERLVKRHLEEIDSSDPDICYKYALHLSKLGPGSAHGVIRWSETALENRSVWSGDTYTSRVTSLYKFRSAAGQALWQKAEGAYAQDPNDVNKGAVDKWRNATKTYSREWYEYAKVAGKDTTQALQLCMSAAGTKDFCEAP